MITNLGEGGRLVVVVALLGLGCEPRSRAPNPSKDPSDVEPGGDGADGGTGETDGGEVPLEDCRDGQDNDGDGLVDCADDDCEDVCVEDCEDGVDNDDDGTVDCADPDCDGGCPEDCEDGRDNDGDGALDCGDTDCDGLCAEACADERDNDGDGLVDCADDDCDGSCPEDCEDGRDNDGDGLLDCMDDDCDGSCPEDCEDGRDNDGDGLLDCIDDDCDGSCPEDCTDGRDNDGDRRIDCADVDCDGSCPEDCTDGRDNDGDGLTDCEDGDCVPTAVCQEDCTLGSGDEDLDGLSDCADDDCWGLSGCDGTTLWVAGGRGHHKVGSFTTSIARYYVGTSGTFTSYIQLDTGVGLHWSLSSVSGFARTQIGTASQVCGWNLANAGVLGWNASTASVTSAVVTSRSGFTTTGACGLTSGVLAKSFTQGSSLSWRWQFSSGSSAVGWYMPVFGTYATFASSTKSGGYRKLWTGREADFTLGTGRSRTIP